MGRAAAGYGPDVLSARRFGAGCSVSLWRALGVRLGDCACLGIARLARGRTHAATFFEGLQVEAADYTPALERFERGEDQLAGPIPFHGSFEDREGSSGSCFCRSEPGAGGGSGVGVGGRVRARRLRRRGRALPPSPDAHARCRLPALSQAHLVTHLHGTELRMLDRIERLDAVAVALDTSLDQLAVAATRASLPSDCRLAGTDRELLRQTNLSRYRYGKDWAARLQASARQVTASPVSRPTEASEAVRLLGVPDDLIEVIPNGVDTDLFHRSALSRDKRLKLLRHWLVDDPQGWDESGLPGSIRYPAEALDAFTGRGASRCRCSCTSDVSSTSSASRSSCEPTIGRDRGSKFRRLCLIWGGSPGEWEGEHPYTVARELAVDGVFFSGWRGHRRTPAGTVVCRRVRRSFGR